MDFSSNSFLIVTLAMFAIAVFAVVEGWIPIAVIFVLFGVGLDCKIKPVPWQLNIVQ